MPGSGRCWDYQRPCLTGMRPATAPPQGMAAAGGRPAQHRLPPRRLALIGAGGGAAEGWGVLSPGSLQDAACRAACAALMQEVGSELPGWRGEELLKRLRCALVSVQGRRARLGTEPLWSTTGPPAVSSVGMLRLLPLWRVPQAAPPCSALGRRVRPAQGQPARRAVHPAGGAAGAAVRLAARRQAEPGAGHQGGGGRGGARLGAAPPASAGGGSPRGEPTRGERAVGLVRLRDCRAP